MTPQELKSALDAFMENKVARLDVKHRMAICGVAMILPIIAFAFLVYSPKSQEIEKLEKQQKQLKQQILEVEATAKEITKHKQEMATTEAKFKAASILLPQQQEIPSLLTNISSLGTASGLDFVTFQPQAESPKDFYAEIPVTIQVSGPYHSVGLFLYQISKLDRIVTVSNISMGSGRPVDGEMMLSTNFNLVTYRFIEPQNDKPKM
ncbi:MAG: type 4a pilus biogenesis protein PilO [Desulfobulbaceae bacterium]|nr:type 4a pilus biogenesis protein PilO [Desulfobulbaceae bacterium]